MLLLSATLTATDTVSVLALIKKSKFPKVHTIIFGEGILNDAVAIILFHITMGMSGSQAESDIFTLAGLFRLFKEFAIVSLISVMLGLLIGYLFLYTAG